MPKESPESTNTISEKTLLIEPSETPGGSNYSFRKVPAKFVRFLWYLFKKVAYVLFLAVAVVVLFIGLEKAAQLALTKSHLAGVYPGNPEMAKRDFTRPVSHYDYDLNPGVCLLFNQSKGNRYEYANNAGFRDPRPISTIKPDDEFRIFLTGGSTAFGLGSSGQAAMVTGHYYLEHRETIAYMLERILNATAPIPGKKIRVYNTAVWGYSYQHLLLRYMTKLRDYKPDLILSLDGVNEIDPVSSPEKDWNYFRQGQFNGILARMFSYDSVGLGAYTTLWLKNNTFLMTFLWRGTDPFFTMETGLRMHQAGTPGKDAGTAYDNNSQEERSQMVTANASAVVRVIEDYHAVLENDGVPHIFALQPLLYLSNKPRHELEHKIEGMEEHRQYFGAPTERIYKYITERIEYSSRHKGYFLLDFTEYFDDTSEMVFTDWCHITAGANYLIARECANVIKETFLKIPLAQGDKVEDKSVFFWNPILTAEVVYAPPAVSDEQGPSNILSGYPRSALYASKQTDPGDRPEIVLDLHREFSLSRLRLVWDDDAVPEEWSVDVSLDGRTWKTWVEGTNKDLDRFSSWPGYEFYGAEPITARFLRYLPKKTKDRSIRLRSWSVSR
ncbi:MAG: discoidin domain-containing protein [Pseudomonadota bacterium]